MKRKASTAQGFTIFVDDAAHGWRVGVVSGQQIKVVEVPKEAADSSSPESDGRDDDADLQQSVTRVNAVLRAEGYKGSGVVLAVPSNWCLCATVDESELPDNTRGVQRREALAYAMEEHLPIASEQVAADFIDAGDGRTLGVCIEAAKLKPIVDALEAASIAIVSIVPAAVLGAQRIERDNPRPDTALLAFNGRIDVFRWREGRLADWTLLPHAPADLRLAMRLLDATGQSPTSIALAGLSDEAAAALDEEGIGEVRCRDDGLFESASLAASEAISGRSRPWVDLRRGPLAVSDTMRVYRVPLRAMGITAIVALVTLSAALLYRAQRYDALADAQSQQAVEVFAQTLSDQKTPPMLSAVRSRMASEYRRRLAMTGRSGGGAAGESAPQQASALATLYRLLDALPKNLRYRVLEVRIEPDGVHLDGQARSHGEADAIAEALRKGGLEAQPPRTQRLRDGKGVGFVITCSPGAEKETQP